MICGSIDLVKSICISLFAWVLECRRYLYYSKRSLSRFNRKAIHFREYGAPSSDTHAKTIIVAAFYMWGSFTAQYPSFFCPNLLSRWHPSSFTPQSRKSLRYVTALPEPYVNRNLTTRWRFTRLCLRDLPMARVNYLAYHFAKPSSSN